MQATSFDCPNCGASVAVKQETCDYCASPIVISSMKTISHFRASEVQKYLKAYNRFSKGSSEQIDLSKGICYLKLGQYQKALTAFDAVIDQQLDNASAYFYASIALLNGKKAFQAKRSIVEQVIDYLDSACLIDEQGIYRCFLAYIKYDYFYRKFIPLEISYKEELEAANSVGYSVVDVESLFEMLGISQPNIY